MKKQAYNLTQMAAALITLLLFSCQNRPTTKAELLNFIRDSKNGLQKEKKIGMISATLTCMPLQLLTVAKKSSKKVSTPFVTLFKNDKQFFVWSLSANNRELLKQLDYNRYSELIQVLSFRMSEFVKLIPDKGNAIMPEICQFQQTFGISRSNNLLIVFRKKELQTSGHFTIRIAEFGLNTGTLDYDFNAKDIKELPTLIY